MWPVEIPLKAYRNGLMMWRISVEMESSLHYLPIKSIWKSAMFPSKKVWNLQKETKSCSSRLVPKLELIYSSFLKKLRPSCQTWMNRRRSQKCRKCRWSLSAAPRKKRSSLQSQNKIRKIQRNPKDAVDIYLKHSLSSTNRLNIHRIILNFTWSQRWRYSKRWNDLLIKN